MKGADTKKGNDAITIEVKAAILQDFIVHVKDVLKKADEISPVGRSLLLTIIHSLYSLGGNIGLDIMRTASNIKKDNWESPEVALLSKEEVEKHLWAIVQAGACDKWIKSLPYRESKGSKTLMRHNILADLWIIEKTERITIGTMQEEIPVICELRTGFMLKLLFPDFTADEAVRFIQAIGNSE